MKNIPFNKPYLTGKEAHYLYQAVYSGKISGNGNYTNKCQDFFKQNYGFNKVLLTTSCTDALEMAAILVNIEPKDEVIIPSYTFVSTANPFILRGGTIKFADSDQNSPHISISEIERLITPKTKAIVPVHYAGIACDMDSILNIARKHNLYVIEDAAQAVDSYYKSLPLGGIGDLGAFSFHETKNIISGEGGLICVNNKKFIQRSEIIWEKGTNRSAFFRGETDKYSWVDVGSSFLPSEIVSSFLFAQLENIKDIQAKRKFLWDLYYESLQDLQKNGFIELPIIPEYATNNAHMFYIICKSLEIRSKLIHFLKENGVLSVFHYLSLHKSPFFKSKHDGGELPNSDRYSETLLRLPLYYELKDSEVFYISSLIQDFFNRER